jgi:hypothetical protein
MKKLLITLVVLVIGGGVFAYLYYESGIRRAIEIAGSNALGVPVTVTGVSLSPFTGEGSIRGLSIANPEGFDAPYAIELGGVDIAINVGSLASDIIEIKSILVSDANITYETKVVTDNIRTLLNNLPGANAAPVIEANPDAPASPKVVISDLRIMNPQINLHTRVASAPIPLPDIQLQNIGEKNNAVTVAEAARQIIGAINVAVIREGIPNMDVLLDGARQQLQEGAKKVGDAVEELGNDVRSLFDR